MNAKHKAHNVLQQKQDLTICHDPAGMYQEHFKV